MSQTATEPGNRLSEVLSRIQALSRQERPAIAEDNIPRLMETYEGNSPLNFVVADSKALPTLQHALHDEVVDEAADEHLAPTEIKLASDQPGADVAPEKLSAIQREQLLQEMEPVIRDAVKRAILKELVVIERALKTTLEQDLMEALKQRLESERF